MNLRIKWKSRSGRLIEDRFNGPWTVNQIETICHGRRCKGYSELDRDLLLDRPSTKQWRTVSIRPSPTPK